MSVAKSKVASPIEASLSRWENEGGASEQPPAPASVSHLKTGQSICTELEQLHIRMIATENLLMALLAQDPDRTGQMADAIAKFISPRPGFTQHSRTLRAAAQMVHVVGRAHYFHGWLEGEAHS